MLWHIFKNGWEDKDFINQRVYGMDDVRAEAHSACFVLQRDPMFTDAGAEGYAPVAEQADAGFRRLLTILEKLILSRTPLVVVAPSLSDEVRGTLEVNAIQQTMTLLAVTPPNESDLVQVAEATNGQARTRSDLQAGYVWPEHLGSCARWVSTANTSYVITESQRTSPNPTPGGPG